MSAIVVDGSAILSFVLKDESSGASIRVRERLKTRQDLYVPGHWRLEIINALLMAERRGRILASDFPFALEFIGAFSITVDGETASRCVDGTLPLARKYALTIYDAAYLELALRRRAALATMDKALARAAKAAGVNLVD